MRSKFRVNDLIVTRVAIEIPCCETIIEKGAQGKVKYVDADSGDLIIGLSGHYPELQHRKNIIDIAAAEAPDKIERIVSRMERSSLTSHLAIGGGVGAVLVILILHFSFKPVHATELLPSAVRDALALPRRIAGPLPLAIPALCARPELQIHSI